jgi:hypothetical protein
MVGARVDENHWFDKFAWSEFERPQDGPKGGGQDARNNLLATTNIKTSRPLNETCGLWYGSPLNRNHYASNYITRR